MFTQPDDYPERVQRIVSRYLEEGHDAAQQELESISYPPREVAKRSGLFRSHMVAIWQRDGWLCRYCGGQTIFTPLMALLGDLFPQDFPFHPAWKGGRTHPAVIVRSPVVDHIYPGSLGGSWTDPANLATACSPCNERKADLTLEQLGWILRPVPQSTGWDGLTHLYPALWDAAGRPKPKWHQSWIRVLIESGVPGMEIPENLAGDLELVTSVPRPARRTPRINANHGMADSKRQWDENSFMSTVHERYGAEDEAVCQALLVWCREYGDGVRWGKGSKDGSMSLVVRSGGSECIPFTAATWSGGTVDINFAYLKRRLPFADESLRRELLEQLNTIPAVQFSIDQLGGYPSIPFRKLRSAENQQLFFSAIEWVVSVIRGAA